MSITSLLHMLQFGDSALPVGAFSFSNGLESAVQQQIVRDAAGLQAFVLEVTEQAARMDGVALLHAHRAALAGDLPAVLRCDHALLIRKLNEEQRLMAVRMGRKLGELAAPLVDTPLLHGWLAAVKAGESPGTYAAALGVVAAGLGLHERQAFAMQQYGVATMLLGAALRLLRINHLETQRILFVVNAEAEAAYDRVRATALEDMAAFAPVLDILAAYHVTAHVRMFMN